MEEGHDFYARLKVGPTASKKEIKGAYLEAAKRIHPDKLMHLQVHEQKLAADNFKHLLEAYETLSNSAKKTEYDLKTFSGIRIPQPAPQYRQPTDLNKKSNMNSNFNKRKVLFFFLKLSVIVSALVYKSFTDFREKKVKHVKVNDFID